LTGNLTLTLGGSVELVLVNKTEDQIQTYTTIRHGRFFVTAKGNQMAFNLPADMQVEVQVAYVDRNNNPATVQTVAWTSSDDNIATATVDASDFTLATIVPGTAVGACQITATADADLGEGVKNIVTLLDLTVVAGEAVAGVISPVGAPTPRP